MKFGCSLVGVSPRHYAEIAVAAERLGFESVWISEHLVFPAEMPADYPYTEGGTPPVSADTPLYDPWVVLGYLAHATSTIRLGTDVYILPLRHPLVTARAVTTLDRLSGGRVILGAGVGWLDTEFAAVGLDFHRRGRRTDEIVPLLRRLWSEDVIEHHSDDIDFGPVKFQPKPVQKPAGPPIELGGAAPAALRRAGRMGDGWIEIGASTLPEFAEMLAVVEGARRDAGRADAPFDITVTSPIATDLDGVRRAAEAGATRVVTTGPPFTGKPATPAEFVAFLEHYADTIISQV